jgi:integrase
MTPPGGATDVAAEWAAAIGVFVARHAESRAASTLAVMAGRLRRTGAALEVGPWQVSRADLAGYVETMTGTTRAVKANLGALRAFYRWAHETGRIEHNPMPEPGAPARARTSSAWQDAMALFAQAQHDAGIAASVVSLRIKHVGRAADSLRCPPWQVDPGELRDWLDGLEVAPGTRASMRQALRAFYRWAESAGRVRESPAAALGKGKLRQAETPESWRAALRGFATAQRGDGHPETTVNHRAGQLRHLARDMPSADPMTLTRDDLAEWLAGKRWARETRRGMVNTLRAFYGWAVSTGRASANPAATIAAGKTLPPSPRPASDQAYQGALARAGRRERLALRLAAELGMRRGEVAAVHSDDLAEHGGLFDLRVTGKGGRTRIIPVPDALAWEIRARGAGFVFPGAENGHLSPRHLGKLISQLLPAGVTMHALRHRFATRAYAVDRDVFTVQQLLGHASPATTQLYVLVPDDAKRRLVAMVSDG